MKNKEEQSYRKERFNLSQVITICIFVLIAMVLFALASCSKDDDTANNNNRDGQPYKFRVEVSTQYPDSCLVNIALGSYNFTEKSGLPRTIWLTDPDSDLRDVSVVSPLIQEYEIPSNFTKFYLNVGNYNRIWDAVWNDTNSKTNCTLKVYVDNKLVYSDTKLFNIGWGVAYDATKKKYVYKDGNGNTVETANFK